jgi:tetratricopeptide (TPR) repeat protein
MIRFNPLLLAVLLVPAPLLAQSPDRLFEEGNAAYQKGDLGKATELYESILHNGYVSSDLYYNLGNAYYRQGNLPRAILNYERAFRLTPGDDDLRHNLRLANQMITDRIEPVPRLFIWDWWNGIKVWFSFDILTWLFYVSFVLEMGAVSLIVLGRSYRFRKVALLVALGEVVVVFFFGTVFFARISDAHRTDEAIVMSNVVNVKNSPDERSTDAFVIHGGLKVQLIDQFGSWTKIRLADGKVGWVEGKEFEVI